jgi:hypothetical protein
MRRLPCASAAAVSTPRTSVAAANIVINRLIILTFISLIRVLKTRAVVFSSNSLSKRAFKMHSRPQLRLNAAARLGPIVLKIVS